MEYIEDGPLFNIWRAPLANDIDPWGSYTYSKENRTEGLGRSLDNTIRTLGMKDLTAQLIEINRKVEDLKIVISIHKFYNSSNLRGAFECFEEFTILPDGTIDVHCKYIPHRKVPEVLPRIGWQFLLPKTFSELSWYGRGPFETYPDRKTGAKIGIYESDVNKEYIPYIIPQDYGNHADVRWMNVHNGAGRGLKISSSILYNFSFQKYSTENLSRAMYTYQLKEASFNTLNIDCKVSGVGGTAIRQLERYRVKAEEGEFAFSIKPY
jgi:beta-galactosidase